MTETAKKKRGMPSSFTILLALLAIVAVITVIVSGTSGGAVTAARLSDFCTAPIKGFADALPVCLFVMILGGFLGMMTEPAPWTTASPSWCRSLRVTRSCSFPC